MKCRWDRRKEADYLVVGVRGKLRVWRWISPEHERWLGDLWGSILSVMPNGSVLCSINEVPIIVINSERPKKSSWKGIIRKESRKSPTFGYVWD